MITTDVLNYHLQTKHLAHRQGYPLRRRMALAAKSVGPCGSDWELRQARLAYLVRGAFLADVYKADGEDR